MAVNGKGKHHGRIVRIGARVDGGGYDRYHGIGLHVVHRCIDRAGLVLCAHLHVQARLLEELRGDAGAFARHRANGHHAR